MPGSRCNPAALGADSGNPRVYLTLQPGPKAVGRGVEHGGLALAGQEDQRCSVPAHRGTTWRLINPGQTDVVRGARPQAAGSLSRHAREAQATKPRAATG